MRRENPRGPDGQEMLVSPYRRVRDERDELARQLEEARRLACHYAELLHQAHDSRVIIERDARTR